MAKSADFPDFLPLINKAVDILVGNEVPDRLNNEQTLPEMLVFYRSKIGDRDYRVARRAARKIQEVIDILEEVKKYCENYKKFEEITKKL